MKNAKPDTTLVHAGRNPHANHGIVNPPVYHCSTVLFPTVQALEDAEKRPYDGVRYGRAGTPTSFAFEDAVAALEGGHRAVSMGSGLSAITTVLTAFTKAGDHVLVTDSVYGPTRRFCTDVLGAYGVETEFYDPLIGADIARLLRPNTSVVYLESPGSLTFEVQDVPAIAAAAKSVGAKVLMDNTWATPLFFRPFDHGVDVSIHAATKYLVGHADAMMGVAVCTEESFVPVKRTANILISDEELAQRRAALKAAGGYKYPKSQTPWQEIQRKIVGELSEGMVLKPAVKYQKIHKKFGVPRDNH